MTKTISNPTMSEFAELLTADIVKSMFKLNPPHIHCMGPLVSTSICKDDKRNTIGFAVNTCEDVLIAYVDVIDCLYQGLLFKRFSHIDVIKALALTLEYISIFNSIHKINPVNIDYKNAKYIQTIPYRHDSPAPLSIMIDMLKGKESCVEFTSLIYNIEYDNVSYFKIQSVLYGLVLQHEGPTLVKFK